MNYNLLYERENIPAGILDLAQWRLDYLKVRKDPLCDEPELRQELLEPYAIADIILEDRVLTVASTNIETIFYYVSSIVEDERQYYQAYIFDYLTNKTWLLVPELISALLNSKIDLDEYSELTN